jgi:hypothetical protein
MATSDFFAARGETQTVMARTRTVETPDDAGQLHARVPQSLIEELQRRARLEERSLSQQVRVALREHLAGGRS